MVPPLTVSWTWTGPHCVCATAPVTVVVCDDVPDDFLVADFDELLLLPLVVPGSGEPELVVPDATDDEIGVSGVPPCREASKPTRRTTADTVERIQYEMRLIGSPAEGLEVEAVV